jgi:hypothetical protein
MRRRIHGAGNAPQGRIAAERLRVLDVDWRSLGLRFPERPDVERTCRERRAVPRLTAAWSRRSLAGCGIWDDCQRCPGAVCDPRKGEALVRRPIKNTLSGFYVSHRSHGTAIRTRPLSYQRSGSCYPAFPVPMSSTRTFLRYEARHSVAERHILSSPRPYVCPTIHSMSANGLRGPAPRIRLQARTSTTERRRRAISEAASQCAFGLAVPSRMRSHLFHAIV